MAPDTTSARRSPRRKRQPAGSLQGPQGGQAIRHLQTTTGIVKPEVLTQPFGKRRPMIVLEFLQKSPDMAKGRRLRNPAADLVLNIHGRMDSDTKLEYSASLVGHG